MNTNFTVTYICLVISLWDWISSLNAEHDFLWSRPWQKIRAAQVLYFLTRYSALFCQGVNFAIVHLREEHASSMSSYTCRRLLFFSIATVGWSLGLLLANLMLRVYALYTLDFRILLTLAFLLVVKLANVLVCWFVLLPRLTFDPFCAPTNARPTRIAIFTFIEVVVQAIPVYLTLARGAKIERATRARRVVSILRYMRRDGVLSWTAITMYSISFLSVAFATRNIADTLMYIAYPIFNTFMSFLGCHLILNFSQSNAESTSEPPNTVLTSLELDVLRTAWDNSCDLNN